MEQILFQECKQILVWMVCYGSFRRISNSNSLISKVIMHILKQTPTQSVHKLFALLSKGVCLVLGFNTKILLVSVRYQIAVHCFIKIISDRLQQYSTTDIAPHEISQPTGVACQELLPCRCTMATTTLPLTPGLSAAQTGHLILQPFMPLSIHWIWDARKLFLDGLALTVC